MSAPNIWADEEWRDIPGYEGHYQVSNLGRVRSLDRLINTKQGPRLKRGLMRKPKNHSCGYLELPLKLDGKQEMFTIHRLVMLAFVGPRPDGLDICHNNGDKKDNRLSNLRYDTRSANNLEAVAHGQNWQRNKTHCAQGHPYDEMNTKWDKNGRRHCFACSRAATRAHYYNNPDYYQARYERQKALVV